MLGGNGAGIGTRAGGARPGNGTGLTALQVHNPGTNMSGAEGGRFDDRIREYSAGVVYSGSEPESDSGDDDETMGSAGDRRGVKRERAEMEVAASATSVGLPPGGYGGVTGGATGAKPGKKTRGRVKIKMEFIDNKLRRYTTFSKRKTGIMKKPTFTMANLPASVNTQPTSTSSSSTSSSSSSVAMHLQNSIPATCWQVSSGINTHSATSSANGTVLKTSATSTSVMLPGGFTLMSGTALPPGMHTIPLSQLQALQGTLAQTSITTATAGHTQQGQQTTLLRLPATVSLTGGGMGQQLQAIQVHPSSQQSSVSHSDLSHITSSSTVSLPTTIVTSSVPSTMGGHMMYPGAHTVMYATPTTSLGDGSLTVLNTFPQTAHTQSHDPGAVSQVFLTGHPGTVQIPVSAVQLHPMVIGQQSSSSSSNLTELQVVNLDAHHHSKDD
ncbi:serum response factor-like isoform X3 [Coregonus clupeaformis]|uniref:serum response factor-like isoform X3 n=1 Tax=Coregonus clupeaformis TaxID=59861 RepID=UPI001E1C3F47|nr:serum response factor-like isoform X3 [Coregonus clupeaformis]